MFNTNPRYDNPLRQYVLDKLKERNIESHKSFMMFGRQYFRKKNYDITDYYSRLNNLSQALKGNVKFTHLMFEEIVFKMLNIHVDDNEICQLIRIGRGNDLRGQTFGRLTAVECLGPSDHHLLWRCECSCGNTNHTILGLYLVKGCTSSCGCYRIEKAIESMNKLAEKHKMSRTVEYTAYINMKTSCYNPNSSRYRSIGGKGIVICDRWKDSFVNFYNDMGKRPKNGRLRRIDETRDFSPENCYWYKRRI